jgi:glycosyltransferase involved in cell wall biosynthesis
MTRSSDEARSATIRGSVNLLLFNLAMDADHATLGHTTAWTNALARRVDHVSVITMLAGRVAVEPNVTVRSLGKELGRSEPSRLLTYYRLVHRVLRERPIDACFAHMAPLFAALFAPVAKPSRIPTLLWFAHTSVTPALRLAHSLVDRCVTPTPVSFPLPSPKLAVVGHGIDTSIFRPPRHPAHSYAQTVVSVGRVTPIKRIEEMLEAFAILRAERGLSLRLELVGGPATDSDRGYLEGLRSTATELGVHDLVAFRGPVPYGEVPVRYHAGGLVLNLSDGAMDKAILEGMASGCVPISRNPAFQELARAHGLDWLVPDSGAHRLADCILGALDRTRTERPAIVALLRRIVTEEHSLNTLTDRIMAHLIELARSSHGRSARGR